MAFGCLLWVSNSFYIPLVVSPSTLYTLQALKHCISCTLYALIADPPRLTLIMRSSSLSSSSNGNDEIQEGSNVTLVCEIQANPSTTHVSWMFEGLPLMQATDDIIFDNLSLQLLKIGRERAGKYNCLSANVEGEGMSNDIHLRVQCTLTLYPLYDSWITIWCRAI